jgi:hypothetical protein
VQDVIETVMCLPVDAATRLVAAHYLGDEARTSEITDGTFEAAVVGRMTPLEHSRFVLVNSVMFRHQYARQLPWRLRAAVLAKVMQPEDEIRLLVTDLEHRYTSQPVPPCKHCGGDLKMAGQDASGVLWHCSPYRDTNPDGSPICKDGRRRGDGHGAVQYVQQRPGDKSVLLIVDWVTDRLGVRPIDFQIDEGSGDVRARTQA